MPLFGSRTVQCPFCAVGVKDPASSAHFMEHLDDTPDGRLALPCEHPDAVWRPDENFPQGVREHLKRSHGLRI